MTLAEQRIVGLKRQLRRAKQKHATAMRNLALVRCQRDRYHTELKELKAPKGPGAALQGPSPFLYEPLRWEEIGVIERAP